MKLRRFTTFVASTEMWYNTPNTQASSVSIGLDNGCCTGNPLAGDKAKGNK